MLYKLIRILLFNFEPELAQKLALSGLQCAHKLRVSNLLLSKPVVKPKKIMGLTFSNPVGLAAGLDKNGEYIDALAALGFGFIEIGTVTPHGQLGNPKPRLHSLAKEQAIINRMGFNNRGVKYVAKQLNFCKYDGILGVNIGKNYTTPIEHAVDDYLYCFRRVYAKASYVAVNLPAIDTSNLQEILYQLKQAQEILSDQYGRYVPIVIKLNPDITDAEYQPILDMLVKYKIDGIAAANASATRHGITLNPKSKELGDLSGTPLKYLAEKMLVKIQSILQGAIPIISVGGINTGYEAGNRFRKGADLIQIYSGLIFHGPNLIKQAVRQI